MDIRPLEKDDKGNYTPRSQIKLERQYKKIQDKDDTDCTPWDRILRVNYFMMKMEVNKTIEDRLESVFESQKKLEHTAKMFLVDPIQKMDIRIQELELQAQGKNSKLNKLDELSTEIKTNKISLSE